MLLHRLRHDTRERHERVELTLGLLDRPPAAGEYRTLLRKFYGYYEPVEARLASLPWEAVGFDWPARRKVPMLERDLIALGDDRNALPAVPRCPHLPPLTTLPAALGCVYVLEGATLGGRVITRRLGGVPGGPLPAAFFASYGDDVGRRWTEFGAFLTAYATGRDEDDEIVESARQTFDTLGAWLAAGEAG